MGEGGYQVGNFPARWSEWNGKYRDSFRDYWRGKPLAAAEVINRFMGSPDLYERTGLRPYGSVNLITCHDGFTFRDLVPTTPNTTKPTRKRTRTARTTTVPGTAASRARRMTRRSTSCRGRQQRDFLTTLMLSQGIPLLSAGSEIGHTQHGNNNAYCQDNEISWLDWAGADEGLRRFVTELIQLRKDHPVLHRWKRITSDGEGSHQIIGCCRPDGLLLTEEEWETAQAGSISFYLSGDLQQMDHRGAPITDNSFCALMNPGGENVAFVMPSIDGGHWKAVVNTAAAEPPAEFHTFQGGDPMFVAAHSMMVFRHEPWHAATFPAGPRTGYSWARSSASTRPGAGRLPGRSGDHPLVHLALPSGRAGQRHGYDVADTRRVSGELGGAEGVARLRDALRGTGWAWLWTSSPTTRPPSNQNPLWRDVLENGRGSRWADSSTFDWDRPGAGAVRAEDTPSPAQYDAGGLSRGRWRCPHFASGAVCPGMRRSGNCRWPHSPPHARPTAKRPGRGRENDQDKAALANCWIGSITDWPSGGRPAVASIIDASSTSPAWWAFELNARRSLNTRTPACWNGYGGAWSMACESTTFIGLAIPPDTCAGCARRARGPGSWSRRYLAWARNCRRTGRWTVPRVTTSSTRLAGFSSIPWAKRP